LVIFGLLLAGTFVMAGCSPSLGSLSGKVTIDGQPLKGGRVDFYNKDGQSASIEIKEDGTYSLPVIAAGEYSVTVSTDYLKGRSFGGMPGAGSGSGRPGMKGAAGMKGSSTPPIDIKKDKDAIKNTPPEGYVMSNPGDSAKKYVKIPSKYEDAGQSGLAYTAIGGAQIFDIPLVGK
jgi:hypothetical protein